MPLPARFSKPMIVASVASVLLLATFVGIKFLPSGDDSGNTANPPLDKIPPALKSPDKSASGNTPRKSTTQRPATDKIESERVDSAPSRKEAMIALSIRARRDLKLLREGLRNELESVEAREEFARKIRDVSDPAERKRLLEERADSMRIARNKADASKGFPGRAREKRLIALMQVQSLWRMNSHLSQNRSLKTESAQFDDQLAEWVEKSEGMSDEEFHQSFNDLQRSLNELRIRDQAMSTRKP